jgi:hypothetical protein
VQVFPGAPLLTISKATAEMFENSFAKAPLNEIASALLKLTVIWSVPLRLSAPFFST